MSPAVSLCQGYSETYIVYCRDALDIYDVIEDIRGSTSPSHQYKNWSSIPLIVQFGDAFARSRTVPIISKYRKRILVNESISRFSSEATTCNDPYLKVDSRPPIMAWTWDSYYWDAKPIYQPIVWKLESSRHFGNNFRESRYQDIPWEKKKLGAVWIGDMTGGPEASLITPDMSSQQICYWNPRCNFVYQHRNSSLVHARLSSTLWHNVTKENLPEVCCDRMSRKDILEYKILISLEGNDVSSGLKWMLFSNSVVMMKPATLTSWAMEELLVPWLHYLPLNEDGSNAEEMVKWVGENDRKAQRIAERGTLFMYDLVYHPDAEKDDFDIKKEILRRYSNFWH